MLFTSFYPQLTYKTRHGIFIVYIGTYVIYLIKGLLLISIWPSQIVVYWPNNRTSANAALVVVLNHSWSIVFLVVSVLLRI